MYSGYLIHISRESIENWKTNADFNLDKSSHKKERTKTIKIPFFESCDKASGSKDKDAGTLFNIRKNFRTLPIACSGNFPPIIDTLCLKARE